MSAEFIAAIAKGEPDVSRRSSYLDEYLENLGNLPHDIARNLTLLRELDTQAYDKMTTADRLSKTFLEKVESLSKDERAEETAVIQDMFKRAMDIGDDKIELATQTYEMVDRHIRRLDVDMARFEEELKKSSSLSRITGVNVATKNKGQKVTGKDEKKKQLAGSNDDEGPKSGRRKLKQQVQAPHEAVSAKKPKKLLNNPTDVFDMPVDPNEPTYCHCQKVSYGEMIGCDNNDCPIEWFHFSCVGLTTKPKERWYCFNCSLERKKKF